MLNRSLVVQAIWKKRIDEKQAVLDGLMMKIEDVNVVVEESGRPCL